MAGKLNVKQKKFCEEYVVDLNATQAAIRAGYSKRSARATSSRMLTKANVQKFIDELAKKKSESMEIRSEEILGGLLGIARSGKKDSDRIKAYEILGKHKGLWVDRVQHEGNEGNAGGNVVIVLPDNQRQDTEAGTIDG